MGVAKELVYNLTAEEARTIVREKGWTVRELSRRWGVTREWVSRQLSNPDRGAQWDDALMGLPSLVDGRHNTAARWLAKLRTSRSSAPQVVTRATASLEKGEVLASVKDLNDALVFGTLGAVVHWDAPTRRALVLIGGHLEWITKADWADAGGWLHQTGQTDELVAKYSWVGEAQARKDLVAGVLKLGVC